MNIEIAAGKKLTFSYDQRQDPEDILDLTFVLHESSTLDADFIFAGHASSKCQIKIIMMGQRAQATIRGAYFLRKEEKLELHVMQDHRVKKCESLVLCKGALADASYARYDGMITIAHDAPETSASQENKNILLDVKARAVSVPNLQALNNEVQCSHGSAVGPLDTEQLWYLQSRGLADEQAKKLLLAGFFGDIVMPDVVHSLLEGLV